MKKRINKVTIKRQNELLEKEGIFNENELLGMTVVELIERIGESEIDLLLERLFIKTFYGTDDCINCGSIDLVDGHQYVLDIFEANDFNENLEWFYKITIEEFLNLEDLRVNKIAETSERFANSYIEKSLSILSLSIRSTSSLIKSTSDLYVFKICTSKKVDFLKWGGIFHHLVYFGVTHFITKID